MASRRYSIIKGVLIFALVNFILSESAPQSALVTYLPGFSGSFPSKHYSGYVTLDKKHGKKLFYYFVESERNPSKDPIVLWLNGGPGCSSFDGFVYEHGPFNFEAAKSKGDLPKLHLNPYSWSKVSNIIYLDSPVGTGFSFSRNTSDYITGDLKTASDTYIFLLKWFRRFSEFIGNLFFIAGESYAGVFIPTLASNILKGHDSGSKPIINLKIADMTYIQGYMIGNGVTDEQFDGNALVPFAHGMGLISDGLYEEVVKECQGSYYNSTTPKCNSKLDKVDEAIGDLNGYDILEPCFISEYDPEEPCSHCVAGAGELDNESVKSQSSFSKLGQTQRPLPVRIRIFGHALHLVDPARHGFVSLSKLANKHTALCNEDKVASKWLNNAAVRKAIHAKEGSVTGPWQLCTNRIKYTKDAGSMIKYHKRFTSLGLRVLIYSGDHDMVVPYTGSEAWTRSLGYKIIDEWRPWISDAQVAGYSQGYDKNLTFLTVKGAGHTVPEYKPREALDFYTRWLAGKKI
ncbi:hypothetical protein Cgig2_012790 [Carnegiea gigantea]|uniref:Carboxypeptidase n=1 Tax=Carnegiea gigantea TaxID=171969 RepID=A0A9Q1QFX6_9CARY|nr:hypothetical protein Cgig2_012790 [Carnegiea gigantea]